MEGDDLIDGNGKWAASRRVLSQGATLVLQHRRDLGRAFIAGAHSPVPKTLAELLPKLNHVPAIVTGLDFLSQGISGFRDGGVRGGQPRERLTNPSSHPRADGGIRKRKQPYPPQWRRTRLFRYPRQGSNL
jgi:hypothetical protein